MTPQTTVNLIPADGILDAVQRLEGELSRLRADLIRQQDEPLSAVWLPCSKLAVYFGMSTRQMCRYVAAAAGHVRVIRPRAHDGTQGNPLYNVQEMEQWLAR